MTPTELRRFIEELPHRFARKALTLGVDPQDVDDALQAVALRLWETRERITSEAYACGVVCNALRDHRAAADRWRRRHALAADPECPPPEPVEAPDPSELDVALGRAVWPDPVPCMPPAPAWREEPPVTARDLLEGRGPGKLVRGRRGWYWRVGRRSHVLGPRARTREEAALAALRIAAQKGD